MTARSIAGQDGQAPATGDRYLLFAGTQHPPNGGLGDLLGTFTSEEVARRAFRDVRLRMSSPTSWAQLAVLDGRHGLTPMCWFGIGAEPERHHPAPAPSSTRTRADGAARERNLPMTKTSVTQARTAAPPRAQPVVLACWLLAFLIVTDIAGPLLPSSEGNIGFGIVASLLTALAATGLWMMRRWGFMAALVVATLTLFSDAPVIAIGSTGLIKVWAAVDVLACALIIVLVIRVRKEARR
jgi:hypothetical protein